MSALRSIQGPILSSRVRSCTVSSRLSALQSRVRVGRFQWQLWTPLEENPLSRQGFLTGSHPSGVCSCRAGIHSTPVPASSSSSLPGARGLRFIPSSRKL